MIKHIKKENMGKSDLGWLQSRFHFSFAEYFNPDNMNFGYLRVINDDFIEAGTGFDTHPHKDMEIITYVVEGRLTHKDSMGNEQSIGRGEVQYMSAGTGILHSEYNNGNVKSRTLQIWIIPEEKNLKPNYGDYKFKWEDRNGKWLNMVSHTSKPAPIKIYQDVNISAIFLKKGEENKFTIENGRQAYLVEIEGSCNLNNITMNFGDACEIVEGDITIKPITDSHIILFEMEKL